MYEPLSCTASATYITTGGVSIQLQNDGHSLDSYPLPSSDLLTCVHTGRMRRHAFCRTRYIAWLCDKQCSWHGRALPVVFDRKVGVYTMVICTASRHGRKDHPMGEFNVSNPDTLEQSRTIRVLELLHID